MSLKEKDSSKLILLRPRRDLKSLELKEMQRQLLKRQKLQLTPLRQSELLCSQIKVKMLLISFLEKDTLKLIES